MSAKIFRDPLYNYVSIHRPNDGWLIDLLDCPEMQRLRRIHQLGVSSVTYPGADHNRLSHSLGVLHLMQQAIAHVESQRHEEHFKRGRAPLLAAALTHDIGHGPFSHLFELCLGVDHEAWSNRIVLCEDADMRVHRVLRNVDRTLPRIVADLLDKDNDEQPSWMQYLLSSQLDTDRLDYLRRDSLFTGAGYGHYDYYRLLNTFELHRDVEDNWDIVWPEKALLAIEEYIFSRYYMYQNVYLHKTTRGFEKLLEAAWRRAKNLRDNGVAMNLTPAIRDFWAASEPSVQQYLRIEEFTLLQQMQQWCDHPDKPLCDLSRRFLARDRLSMIEAPPQPDALVGGYEAWEAALLELVGKHAQYVPPDMYCLVDRMKAKYNRPYMPEVEDDEQSIRNAIRVVRDGKPVEVSRLLERLRPLTVEPIERVRYYVPRDLAEPAKQLATQWNRRR